ncbi:MAG: Asp-tRNA(Asn)/Glu-tRNA(Gln) amidotransferase subunit GatB [Deltaproteobacteria bacterium]|nr:Asp-tRNA(Asn)/Glu-tRNA(Gln) amidotransferase subunit GatB [Deltaproteobacteria bacterium]
MTTYETVIGLEVHAQLLTRSKLFCGCSTAFGAPPNAHVCPTCLGLPGSLPVTNGEAVRLAVRAGLLLGATIRQASIFARKQYFYPDLPKGYQISQFEEPIAEGGHLDVPGASGVTRVRIRRAHLEEDAGKNVHGVGGDSLVDLNRAGTPLLEIVSEPDLRSGEDAAEYLRLLRELLMFAGVNDGNLEEGSFRCDANVSVRPRGTAELGTRTELKNINSFRFVARAIEVESARQVKLLEAGGRVLQETRSYDPGTETTATLRSKEEAHDYRYFPDPDLPPLVVPPALLAAERDGLPEPPAELRRRLVAEQGLTQETAETLTQHPAVPAFFREALAVFPDAVKLANWIVNEVLRDAELRGTAARFPVTPTQVGELLALVEGGEISGKQAKELGKLLAGTSRRPAELAAERGMRRVSDEGALLAACEAVLAANARQVGEYRSGKQGLLGYFVGQVMKATRGQGDPKLVSELLVRLLGGA